MGNLSTQEHFFLILGQLRGAGGWGWGNWARRWQGAEEDSDQNNSLLTQNKPEAKTPFSPPSSVTGEGGEAQRPPSEFLWRRSWVLTNPDSRLKSHLAHTQNGWFNLSGGARAACMYSRSVSTGHHWQEPWLSASLLTTLLGQWSMPLCVQHWV